MMVLIKEAAFVDGCWVQAGSGRTFPVFNPANGKVIANVPDMDGSDTYMAIDAAEKAFASWKKTTAKQRAYLLRRWFELCNDNLEELAMIVTSEQGKPISGARKEVAYGSSYLEWYSEEARRINGDVIPAPVSNRQMILMREPIGVAAMVTPWNFPYSMITRKMGAALASGCTCVLKPAGDTPLSALALMVLAEKAGIPKGVVNVVTCSEESAPSVGKALCSSPKVAALSFTGSTGVGKLLYRQCADTVKKISLELGGNAPFIVFDSAKLDLAINGCMASKFRNGGQSCISSNRIFVQSGIYEKFVTRLKETVKGQIVVGDGMKDGVNQGPLTNKRQLKKVSLMVEDAINKGAHIELGGKRHIAGDLCYEPTILTDLNTDMDIFQDEIFGPVIPIMKFDTEEEVIELVNDSRVGLGGYFYSNDVSQCWRVARNIEVGMVGINEGIISCAEGPHGGVKESGLGCEGSKYGIDEYTNIKYICFGNV